MRIDVYLDCAAKKHKKNAPKKQIQQKSAPKTKIKTKTTKNKNPKLTRNLTTMSNVDQFVKF